MDTEKNISQQLKAHNLRNTIIRRYTLKIFLTKGHALTHSEIEAELSEDFDRVTIYRTLKTFEEHGLIHKVIDEKDVIKYAICSENCNSKAHADNHVHFKCHNCNNTYCLHQVSAPTFSLPEGYHPQNYEVLITGICPDCESA